MLTAPMTIGDDDEIIWVVKLYTGSSWMYFSTEVDKITLSGIDFDGKVLFKDGMESISEEVDITMGGNIGTVSNFKFSIARYNSYTGSSNFHEDFYPASGKPLLTSKEQVIFFGYINLS
jgi:hypothetical protein